MVADALGVGVITPSTGAAVPTGALALIGEVLPAPAIALLARDPAAPLAISGFDEPAPAKPVASLCGQFTVHGDVDEELATGAGAHAAISGKGASAANQTNRDHPLVSQHTDDILFDTLSPIRRKPDCVIGD